MIEKTLAVAAAASPVQDEGSASKVPCLLPTTFCHSLQSILALLTAIWFRHMAEVLSRTRTFSLGSPPSSSLQHVPSADIDVSS